MWKEIDVTWGRTSLCGNWQNKLKNSLKHAKNDSKCIKNSKQSEIINDSSDVHTPPSDYVVWSAQTNVNAWGPPYFSLELSSSQRTKEQINWRWPFGPLYRLWPNYLKCSDWHENHPLVNLATLNSFLGSSSKYDTHKHLKITF